LTVFFRSTEETFMGCNFIVANRRKAAMHIVR
jgi:hypothetical protein